MRDPNHDAAVEMYARKILADTRRDPVAVAQDVLKEVRRGTRHRITRPRRRASG